MKKQTIYQRLDRIPIVLYSVRYMIQIVNISDARNNFAKLVRKIKETKKPVVIVQDSIPSAVIYPYEEALKNDEQKEQLFQLKFKEVFAEGEKAFKKYLKKKAVKTPRTEQDAYSVIKNA